MQLAADDLLARLERGVPQATYFLHGEEPLQLAECADAVRAAARRAGVGERIVFDAQDGLEWEAVRAQTQAMSLFAARRLIELRLGSRKPDKAAAAVLESLASRGDETDIVLVTAGKLDRRARQAKWCKALERHACCVVTRDLKLGALPGWLVRRARRHGKALSTEAAAVVADRVEGNLLAAAQEIEKLCLLVDGEAIGEADVLGAVGDSARYDVFQLVDAVLEGKLPRAIRVVRGLREEGTEPTLVSWALGRELRQLAAMADACRTSPSRSAVMERFGVWKTRRGLVEQALERLTVDEFSTLLAYAGVIETIIKGARPGNPWDALELLIVNATGKRAFRAMLEADGNHAAGGARLQAG